MQASRRGIRVDARRSRKIQRSVRTQRLAQVMAAAPAIASQNVAGHAACSWTPPRITAVATTPTAADATAHAARISHSTGRGVPTGAAWSAVRSDAIMSATRILRSPRRQEFIKARSAAARPPASDDDDRARFEDQIGVEAPVAQVLAQLFQRAQLGRT